MKECQQFGKRLFIKGSLKYPNTESMWYFSNVVTWKRNSYKHLNGSGAALSLPSRKLFEIFNEESLEQWKGTNKLQKDKRHPKGIMITHGRK